MQKTVLVTGATSGFGRATAELFAAKRWKVIITGRRRNRLESVKKQLGSEAVHILEFDVREHDAVKAAIASLPEPFAVIDVLVNNAGLALGLEMAYETDMQDWEVMVDTNIKGVMYMTRAVLPRMVARKQGHVINIGSVAGDYPYPGANVYGGTKAFVSQFSNNLKADLRGTEVRVTNIEPGLSRTEFFSVRFHGDNDKADTVYDGTRPLAPQDIAEAVYWAANRPAHVNINRIELMPVCQNYAQFFFERNNQVD